MVSIGRLMKHYGKFQTVNGIDLSTTMLNDPQLLILDEPTNGLDP